MSEYNGEWITTYSGSKFHYKKPKLNEIKIIDIAHHLSLLCRYTGACKKFYSVGDHSLRVARIVPEELKLAALLHDAAEAYLNDISRPVKYSHKLEDTEAVVTNIINTRYGIDTKHPLIKKADDILLATEARDLMPDTTGWKKTPEPLIGRIIPLCPEAVEVLFLTHFRYYGGIEVG